MNRRVVHGRRMMKLIRYRTGRAPLNSPLADSSAWLELVAQAKVADAKTTPVEVKSCAPRSRCMSTEMDLDNSPVPRWISMVPAAAMEPLLSWSMHIIVPEDWETPTFI